VAKPKLNILVAYPYCNKQIQQLIYNHHSDIRFILDSGAFTVWKTNKQIKIDDYCRFIESLPFAPWRYFNLDVIGDAAASKKNYQTMLNRGFKPIPVFTRGENLETLEEYYNSSDVVALGGLVATEKNKGFVRALMKKINGRKTHWLGFTHHEFLKYFKPYMADSTSWEAGAKFGACPVYLPTSGLLKTVKRTQAPKDLQDRNIQLAIHQLGFNVTEMLLEKNWRGLWSLSRQLGARSMIKFSLDVEKNLGTKLFAALGTTSTLKMFLEGYYNEPIRRS
jgi:hypothetical protein